MKYKKKSQEEKLELTSKELVINKETMTNPVEKEKSSKIKKQIHTSKITKMFILKCYCYLTVCRKGLGSLSQGFKLA
jgi:hypothetical protein